MGSGVFGPGRGRPVPDDLATALAANAAADQMFRSLNGANRYAVLYRIENAKHADTAVARRVDQFVAMLARGETIHPQTTALMARIEPIIPGSAQPVGSTHRSAVMRQLTVRRYPHRSAATSRPSGTSCGLIIRLTRGPYRAGVTERATRSVYTVFILAGVSIASLLSRVRRSAICSTWSRVRSARCC